MEPRPPLFSAFVRHVQACTSLGELLRSELLCTGVLEARSVGDDFRVNGVGGGAGELEGISVRASWVEAGSRRDLLLGGGVAWSGARSGGEVLLGDLTLRLVLDWVQVGWVGSAWAGSAVLSLSNQVLGLGSVVACGALGELSSAVGVLGGEVADLASLLVDDVTGVVEVGVNDFAV